MNKDNKKREVEIKKMKEELFAQKKKNELNDEIKKLKKERSIQKGVIRIKINSKERESKEEENFNNEVTKHYELYSYLRTDHNIYETPFRDAGRNKNREIIQISKKDDELMSLIQEK